MILGNHHITRKNGEDEGILSYSSFCHRTDIVPGTQFKQQNLIKLINEGHKTYITRPKIH